MNAVYEKKLKIRKKLTNGTYFIRKPHVGSDEIKMQCEKCGKLFWVDMPTAVNGIFKHGACDCSACGTYTLVAYE